MRALALLQKSLKKALAPLHKSRRDTLWVATQALMRGGTLTLTELGRAVSGKSKKKHDIKRMDRLLGNRQMHSEQIAVYRGIAHFLFKKTRHPLILVDWTTTGTKRLHHALVATTPVHGCSATVYSEVHPEKLLGSPKVERLFLKRLRAVLPQDCVPTVVTDAGFRTPWFDAVTALGWHFVGRLRHRTHFQNATSGAWEHIKSLHCLAKPQAADLGQVLLTKSVPRWRRLVLIRSKRRSKKPKSKPKRRQKRRSDRISEKSRAHHRERSRVAAKEPWLLATSLAKQTAKQVVNIYSTRMQIEQTFRSWKSHRFGWSFDYARSRDPRRIEILLLLAALAGLAMLLAGLAAQAEGIDRDYQANTERKRRVFAAVFIGRILVMQGHHFLMGAILQAQLELRRIIGAHAEQKNA